MIVGQQSVTAKCIFRSWSNFVQEWEIVPDGRWPLLSIMGNVQVFGYRSDRMNHARNATMLYIGFELPCIASLFMSNG